MVKHMNYKEDNLPYVIGEVVDTWFETYARDMHKSARVELLIESLVKQIELLIKG